MGHGDQPDIYKEECEDDTFPSAIHLCFPLSTVGYTLLYSLQCSTLLSKVSIRPCLLCFMLATSSSEDLSVRFKDSDLRSKSTTGTFYYTRDVATTTKMFTRSTTNTTSLCSRNMSSESDTNTTILGLTETNYKTPRMSNKS